MGYTPPFERTREIDVLCMEIAELVGSITPASELATSLTLHRKLRIRTIHSSLTVEGNTLSEQAVTALLDGKRVLGNTDDIREVKNARRAYDLLGKLDSLNIDDLLRVHKTMMDGLVPDAGMFRTKNAGVYDGDHLIHAGTPANYVPELMASLFDWLRATDLHPLLSSCIFHYEFEFIHPFADGNGRTGRLWHTLLLMRWRPVFEWLPIESVILERQQDYYAAFAQSESAGSSEVFVTLMLQIIRDALKLYAPSPDESALRLTRSLTFFSQNPRATVEELAVHLGCSKRTAERTVAELKRNGKLSREGGNRNGTWVVA